MVLRREITGRIKELLSKYPQGLNITEIVRHTGINRNTAGRYLENLMVSGQVEMRQFGMAKIYRLAQRVPLLAMLSISSELILLLDGDLRVTYANEPLLKLLGTTQKDLYGKNIEYTPCATVCEDAFDTLKKQLKKGLAGKEWSGELCLKNKDIFFFCRIAPAVFEEGQHGVSVLFEDITERKRADELLRDSEATARALINAPTDSVMLLDFQGVILELNETAALRMGRRKDELIGVLADTVLPEEIARARRMMISQVIEKRSAVRFEDERNGIWYDTVAYPIISDRGEVTKIAIIARDITEQKLAKEALYKSEEKFRNIVETSPDMVWEVDMQGTFTYISPQSMGLIGYPPEDLIGKPFFSLVLPDLVPSVSSLFTAQIQEKRSLISLEVAVKHSDGSNIILEIRSTPIFGKAGQVIGFRGFARDVTKQERVTKAFKEWGEVLEGM